MALGKPVTVAGTTFSSLAAASRHFSVDRQVVKQRRKLGWSLEEAFGVVQRRRAWSPKSVEVAGTRYPSLAAAAQAHAVCPRLFASRLRQGRSVEGALELAGAEFEPHRKSLTVGDVSYASIAEACRAHGVTPQQFSSRVNRDGWSAEQALGLEPPPRSKRQCIGFIYKATHVPSGKAYVGLTRSSIETRWEAHVAKALGNDVLPAGSLHEAIRAHGAATFVLEHLAQATTVGELIELEQAHIKAQQTLAPAGFNLNAGGAGANASGKAVVVAGTAFSSVAGACRQLGANPATVQARLRKGASVDEAFGLPVRTQRRCVTFRGVDYESERCLADAYAVNYRTFRTRRFLGKSYEEALGLVPLSGSAVAVVVAGQNYASLKEAAAALGISYNTVVGRRAKGCTLEEAFSTAKRPSPRSQR